MADLIVPVLSLVHQKLNFEEFLSDLELFITTKIGTGNYQELEAALTLTKQLLASRLENVPKNDTMVGSNSLLDENIIEKLVYLCENVLSDVNQCDQSSQIVKSCYSVLCVLFPELNGDKQSEVITQCVDKLRTHLNHVENGCLSLYVTLLHSLHDIISKHPCDDESICKSLTDILHQSLTVYNEQFSVTTLPYLLNLILKAKVRPTQGIADITFGIWSEVKKIHASHCQRHYRDYIENTSLSERPLIILCTSSSLLFSVTESPVFSKIMSDKDLWAIIQYGFFHANPLTRKRSLYILKRIVDIIQQNDRDINFSQVSDDRVCHFGWNVNNKAVLLNRWNDIFLLLEALEEKQVHVIKPLLPKFSALIKATFDEPGNPCRLHTSWITAIFQRIASHESTYIKRWGVSELLQLDLKQCPVYQQGGHDFFTEPFIAMLTESSIYYKPVEVNLGECPPITDDLAKFFKAMFSAVPSEKRGKLLIDLLKSIERLCWSGAALLYVIRGMSFIESKNILSKQGVHLIKDILVSIASSVEAYFRGTIQQYMCTIVANLLDHSSVGVCDVANFFGIVSGSECLRRGTVTWHEMCRWLRETVQKDHRVVEQWREASVLQSVADLVKSSLISETFLVEGPTGCVRFLLLAMDSGLLTPKPSERIAGVCVMSVLGPVLQMLTSLGRHLYMSPAKADSALLVMNALCREAQLHGGKSDDLYHFLKSVVTSELISSILQYVSRRISEVSLVDDIDKFSVYCDTIRYLSVLNAPDFRSSTGLSSLVQQCQTLITETSQINQGHQVHRCAGMMFLSSLCQSEALHTVLPIIKHSLSAAQICSKFKKPNELQSQEGEQKEHGHLDWGRVSSIFLEAQWWCVYSVLPRQPTPDLASYGPLISVAMDVLGGLALIPVFNCALFIMTKVTDEVRLDWLSLSWKGVDEQKKGPGFWPVYNSFIQIFAKTASLASSESSGINDKIKQIIDEIFDLGEEKMGLVNQLMSALYGWWQQSPADMARAIHYTQVIARAVYFGEIHCKGQRFRSEVYHYLQKCGDELSVNQILNHTGKDDGMVRVSTLTFLSRLKASDPTHNDLVLALLHTLFAFYKDVLSQTGYRNFSNSLTHRRKHRIFCAIMVLHLFLDEIQEEMFEFFLHGLLFENQPSVRHQLEWLLTRFLHKHEKFMPQFWSHFEVAGEKKPVQMCSLLSVLTSLANLQSISHKQTFLLTAIPRVFPWATVQQFNIRLFAQGFLLLAWQMSVKQALTQVLTTHSILQTFLDFCQKNHQAKRATEKLLENFVYSVHPFEDFTMENLVSTIPYLCAITDEEWLSVEKFESVADTWHLEGEHSIVLRGKSDALKKCKPGTWKIKYSGYDEDYVECTSDVQKKQIPWRLMLPETDLEAGLQDEYVKKRQNTGGLVLVASLIDKIPNLGGLCRTSEIFGVSEYVLSNLHCVKDKTFESLSVTSHKWLPIKEVKPHYLKMYLLEMREAGYTLVGAEQTANSVCLTDYSFPKKTVLVLGNEKEGIPVDVIQVLDTCVEIPQQGVVRSLNVHVSGALLVWEYTRQHLLNHAQSESSSKCGDLVNSAQQ